MTFTHYTTLYPKSKEVIFAKFLHKIKAYGNMKHVFNLSFLDNGLRGIMLKLCLLSLTLIGGG